MTVKELSQLCYLNREVAQARQDLAELQRRPGDGTKEGAAELAAQVKKLKAKIRQRGRERDRLRQYIESVEDAQMRLILDLRFAKRLSWVQVAHRIGGGNTEDSVRKACFRYLEAH